MKTLLAIDVGNTSISLAVIKDERIIDRPCILTSLSQKQLRLKLTREILWAKRKGASKEQIEAQRLEENAQFFQKEREIRDTEARIFEIYRMNAPDEFQSDEEAKAFLDEATIIATPGMAENMFGTPPVPGG